MRVVDSLDDFVEAFDATVTTSRTLFGDGAVYVERYLPLARHIEIQILCDNDGNGVHLGARDCSVQRRHQKLIEESPAPRLSADVVAEMGGAAVRAALQAGYRGAGTVEFLVAPDGRYYFMEVNCRIQVEHPVTEMVTGIDLVSAQLTIASGEPIGLTQRDVVSRGVAIECRLNAEDPDRGFVPSPGEIETYVPAAGPFVRVDGHLQAGDVVAPEYDSLIAKVVAWAPDRASARARMRRALDEFVIDGPNIRTTREFLLRVIDDTEFAQATHHTNLVDRLFDNMSLHENTANG